MHIKNIVFDLGGVLLNLDYLKTITAFKNLGIVNFEDLYSQAEQNDLFNDLEKGLISPTVFLDRIQRFLPSTVSKKEIIDAWNAMLLDFPKERLDFILRMKEKYNTFLLSNTNAIHLDYFHQELLDKHGISTLDSHFNKVYFSCDMKMRKPDSEIFEKVCDAEQLIPSETLFIDDSIQHVEGAKSIGINAFWLDVQKEDVIQLLKRVLP